MSRLVCCLPGLALLFLGDPVLAGSSSLSPPQQREVAQLVHRLGDESFAVREEASARLRQLGLVAKPFLLEGARDPDLEVRRRCLELLPTVLHADHLARIEAFLADTEGKQEHDFPGWKRFRKAVGDDSAARGLFAEMQKSETATFLAQCDARPDAAAGMIHARAALLQQKLYNPEHGHQPVSLAEVATLLFAGSDERVRMPIQAIYILNSFFYQPTIRAAVTVPASSSPFKRLLLSWMNGQTEPSAVQQVLNMAMTLELKEAVGVALKAVESKTIRGHSLAQALVTIGKLGDKGQLKVLEGALNDRSLIGNFNSGHVRGTTEVRDVALAMMVHVTGQSHADYGFAFVRGRNNMKFSPYWLGFTTAEQRQKALGKWQTYAAAQKP
jgi:hypothetical protein